MQTYTGRPENGEHCLQALAVCRGETQQPIDDPVGLIAPIAQDHDSGGRATGAHHELAEIEVACHQQPMFSETQGQHVIAKRLWPYLRPLLVR